jgi:hypothetical protein
MRFGEWPGFQGFRVVMLWVILVFVVFGWRYYWQMTGAVAEEAARPTFHVGTPLLVAFGPLVLFAIGYAVSKSRAKRP